MFVGIASRETRYLKGVEPAQCPHLKIPMHCVLQLNPKGYGYEEWRWVSPLNPFPTAKMI